MKFMNKLFEFISFAKFLAYNIKKIAHEQEWGQQEN
jgi:hypothetical protein